MDVEEITDSYSQTNEENIENKIRKFINLLDKYNIKANFFILTKYLDKYNNLFKELIDNNHEIALHGVDHTINKDINIDKFAEMLNQAKIDIKNKLGYDVIGYRSPCLNINNDQIDMLYKNGFLYDSSYIGTKIVKYKTIFNIKEFTKINDDIYKKEIVEFGLNAGRLIGIKFPLSNISSFRFFGFLITKHRIKKHIKNHNTISLFLHPYEIFESKIKLSFKVNPFVNLYYKIRIKKTLKFIDWYINYLIKKGFIFLTYREYLQQQ